MATDTTSTKHSGTKQYDISNTVSRLFRIFVLLLVLHPLQGLVTPPWHAKLTQHKQGFASAVSARAWTQPSAKMAAMRQRGGSKKQASSSSEEESDDNTTTKMQKAVQSIKFCSRMSFFSPVVGGCKILVDDFGGFDLDILTDCVTLLNRIVIGFGLRYEGRLYEESRARDGAGAASAQSVYDLCRTDAQIWAQTSFVVTLGATAIANSWEKRAISWMPSIVIQQAASLVVTVALGGVAMLSAIAKKAATKAETEGLPPGKDTSNGATVTYAMARSMGFTAVRFMLLCAGANAILGVVQLVTALTETTWLALAFGLLDVITTVSIGGLLALLKEKTLRAIITATDGVDKTGEDFVGFYDAQTGFYQKIGSVLQSESIFKALGVAKLIYGAVRGGST